MSDVVVESMASGDTMHVAHSSAQMGCFLVFAVVCVVAFECDLGVCLPGLHPYYSCARAAEVLPHRSSQEVAPLGKR